MRAILSRRRQRRPEEAWRTIRQCSALCCASRIRSRANASFMLIISMLLKSLCAVLGAAVMPSPGRGPCGRRSCGNLPIGLARTSARTLPRDNLASFENLAAPDTPRFAPLDGAAQAGDPDGAVCAVPLSLLEVAGGLGEPQIRILHPAGQIVRTQAGDRIERPERNALLARI